MSPTIATRRPVEVARAVAQVAADRERVEQGLRRVLVRAVAGVDDRAADPAGRGEPVRGARGAVPDDDGVGAHRLEGQRGVLEALALGHGRALGREVDDVGREPLGRHLERDPRAGRVLEEQVHDRAAAQGRQLLDRAVGDGGELGGRVEDEDGVVAASRSAADSRCFIAPPPAIVDLVDAVDLGDLDADLLGRARWAGSCRRSRAGSAARGGRGRRARRAARPPGGPTSLRASSAARMVRPENRTSSTRTTVLSSMPPGGIGGGLQRARRAQPQVVAVEGDVERARPAPRCPRSLDGRGDALGEGDAAGGDAEQDEVSEPRASRRSRGRCGGWRGRCRRRRGRRARGDPYGPPSPPLWTGLKGCRSAEP